MPPTLADRLIHILNAIRSIEELLVGKTLADFSSSRHNRAILERELEVISEASRKLPDDIKNTELPIDWAAMNALGNRLRHAYHQIDVGILHSIAVDDLPLLRSFVEKALDKDGRSEP